MEILIYIIEIFIKFFSLYGTEGTLLAFGLILLFFIKGTKERDEKTDKRLEEIIVTQKDMTDEYRSGFVNMANRMDASDERMRRSLELINEQQKENNLMTLRSIVTNKSLPSEYRLKNYDTYIQLGGNSWLTKYVEEEILSKKGE